MALTRITKGVIKPNENYDTHNIVSTGIVTSVGLDVNGSADISGSLSVGGVLTYEDVTSIDSVGLITARSGIIVSAGSSVGIGTDDLTYPLEIHDSDPRISLIDTDLASNRSVQLRNNQGSFVPSASQHTILYTGGSERVRIKSDGMVGIGTDSPSEILHVANSGNPKILIEDTDENNQVGVRFKTVNYDWIAGIHGGINSFKISKHIAFGTNDFFTIDGSGNISIEKDLDVDGHTNLDNVSITGITTVTDGRVRIISPTIANSLDSVTIQGGSSGMSGASDSYAKHGITFLANAYTSSNVTRIGGRMYMEKEGSWHQSHSSPSGYAYGALVFETSESPSGGTANDRLYWLRERLRISAHGNVGIGISRPTSRLHVSGNSLITGVSTFTGAIDANGDLDVDGHTNLDNVSVAGVSTLGGSTQNSVQILHNSGYGLQVKRGSKFLDLNGDWATSGNAALNAGDSGIRFYYGASSDGIQFNTGSGDDKVRITSDAKVGINTITPDTPLHIYANDPQLITVERATSANSSIRYRNSVASMFAGLTSNATGFAIDDDADLSSGPMFFVERSTGNIGVNCTPTAAPLEVKQQSADGGALRLRDSSAQYRYLEFDVTGALTQITARSNNSHGKIDIGTLSQHGRRTCLFIENDGYVGIGTNTPDMPLHLHCTVQNAVKWVSSDSDGPITHYYNGSTHLGNLGNSKGVMSSSNLHFGIGSKSDLLFGTKPSGGSSTVERLRISSNGDVTTTGASYSRANAGFTARKGDSVNITRASGTPLEINRTGNDGPVINFFQDQSIIGSIGVDGADVWFGANGTSYDESVRISSAGRVGIGTDALDSKLTVAGNSATAQIEIKRTNTNVGGSIGALNFTALDGHSVANMLALADGDNEGAHLVFKTTTAAGENSPYGSNTHERLRITNVGRVYIGGQSGRSPGGLTPQLQIEGIDVGTSSMSLTRNSANSGGASIILNKTRGTAVNADTAVKGGDTLGILQFAGNDGGSAESDNAAAWVLAKVDDATSQTMTSNVMPGRLEFHTRSDTSSGSLQERLRITSTGAVNIGGQANPSSGEGKLNVKPSTPDSYFKIRNAADFDGTLTGNVIDNRTSDNLTSRDLLVRSMNLVLWQNTSEKVRITSSGLVQIGGATANSADIDSTNSKLTIKQSANSQEDGIYIERSGERRGHYIYVGGAHSQNDALCVTTNQLGTDTDLLAIDRGGDVIIKPGKVGIGYESPVTQLDVRGSSDASITIGLTNGTKYGNFSCDSSATYLYAYNGNDIVFSTNSGNSFNRKVTIKNDGKFGIGEASPSNQLHIAGTTGSSAGGLLRLDATNGDNFIIFDNTADSTEWVIGNDSGTRNEFRMYYNGGSGYGPQIINIDGTTNNGVVTIDGGTTTLVKIKADSSGTAGLRLGGDSGQNQGTGYVEVHQDESHGGGLFYNGDGSPTFANYEGSDYISLFRLSSGSRYSVMRWFHSSNDCEVQGNMTIDNGYTGSSSTLLRVQGDSAGTAGISCGGSGSTDGQTQCTGYLECHQDRIHGGGISYNGDGSPGFVNNETADHITFYRMSNGTRERVFSYPYNSNTVNFRGTITASGANSSIKNFRITHPHPSKKDTHDLLHSSIEGPQCDNIYRGKVDLVGGTATINLDTVSTMTDGTFVLLNRDVQCFTTNETGWTNVKGSVTGNQLTIIAQENTCTDTISWMVIGERQDDILKSSEIDTTDADGKLIVELLNK